MGLLQASVPLILKHTLHNFKLYYEELRFQKRVGRFVRHEYVKKPKKRKYKYTVTIHIKWVLLGIASLVFMFPSSSPKPIDIGGKVAYAAPTALKPLKQSPLQSQSEVDSIVVEPTVSQAPVSAGVSDLSNLPAIMYAIENCESGGNPTAQNPSSTASGLFQFLDSTWAGYGGYSRAMYAPQSVQEAKALLEYSTNGTSPWLASSFCWG